jgi:hypothetical protein
LPAYVAALTTSEREAFRRIYHLVDAEGELHVPDSMQDWAISTFGSLDAVQHQRVVKITNLITLDGALFNTIRGKRPTDLPAEESVGEAIARTRGGAFCHAGEMTPSDTFGRVRGQYCTTAANLAKYDGLHSLVIFDEHDPLQISDERVRDYVRTAMRWAKRAHNHDRAASYFFLMWNCLWKGGSSIVHGHMQVALGRGMHYARVEHWRRQALLYRLAHGENYFDSLYRVHAALGLAKRIGETRVLASLTPVKEKEILVIGPGRWADDDDLLAGVSTVLRAYLDVLDVQSFNLALYQRPIDVVQEDWDGFPAVVRIVDRGDLEVRTTDVGCMELYGSSVITTDPYQVIEAL